MDDRLKRRLVGATVLVLAAVVFVPMLLDSGNEAPPPSERLIAPQPIPDAPARVVPLDERMPEAAPVTEAKAPALPAEPPKTPVAAPAKSTAAAPAGYAVQLGSFSKADNARGLRDRLVARGYAAFVETEGSITRVYVGPQASRAEAERMLKKLLAETKLKGIVVDFSG
jgi:DedD protein